MTRPRTKAWQPIYAAPLMCVCVFFTLTDRASQSYPVIYAVVNSIRGLLDKKMYEAPARA